LNNPKQIGGLLKNILQEVGLWEQVQGNRLFLDWSSMVGEKIAAHVQPTRFDPDTCELWLEVENPVWRTEIINIREALIARLNERLGAKIIRNIRIM